MEEENVGFDEVYLKYYDMIYRYISRMLRNNTAEAEDLAQEVFWVAFQKWEMLKKHPNIGGFLMVVARNKVMKWSTRQRVLYYDEIELLDALADKLEETNSYDMVELCSAVEETLSHGDLKLLMQYYEYGYSAAEMAKRLGITVSCFKVRVLRMREKLRRGIELAVCCLLLAGPLMIRWS